MNSKTNGVRPTSWEFTQTRASEGVEVMDNEASMRTLGLQRAADSSVATLLYLEIAFCFALEAVVLGRPCAPAQVAGALLIVAGAVASAALSARAAERATPRADAVAAAAAG